MAMKINSISRVDKTNYRLIMAAGELLFIVFCSIAAINAGFIAVYSWFQHEKNLTPNILFTIILILAAYRISNLLIHDLVDDFQLGVQIPDILIYQPEHSLDHTVFYIRSIT